MRYLSKQNKATAPDELPCRRVALTKLYRCHICLSGVRDRPNQLKWVMEEKTTTPFRLRTMQAILIEACGVLRDRFKKERVQKMR